MAAMSTPIQQLPTNPAQSSTTTPLPEDPDVLNVLQEVEKEVAAAMSARSAASSPTPTMQQAPLVQPQPVPVQVMMHQHGAHGGHGALATPIFSSHCAGGVCATFWNTQHAQYAALAAVLALALFYPQSLESFYQRIPKVAGILTQHDKFIRAALFAVVIYAILWKFRL